METTLLVIKYVATGLVMLLVFGGAALLIWYNIKYSPPPPLPGSSDLRTETVETAGPVQNTPILVPVPKTLKVASGIFNLPGTAIFSSEPGRREMLEGLIRSQLDLPVAGNGQPWIRFIEETGLQAQGYAMKIDNGGVEITAGDDQGFFYALITLRQIIEQTEGDIPEMKITDWPDMEVRGVMLDISRDKIPSMETLYRIIDFLSMMKYNHLQLYVEGFSFGYESFPELWEGKETPVTGEEILLLDKYCAERFIDLVPNQNSLGHMSAWLATEQFSDLAECPGGYKLMGLIDFKSTLNVSDRRSMELVMQMTEDMLPWFSSSYFNANLDEPFEIGKCRNKNLAKDIGEGQLYIDWVKELESFISSRGKKMMMWGDVVTRHPDIIPQIPSDVILIEWGYESLHPFDQNCRRYREAGLEFMVAPGTSSWTSITGRTGNMMENISNAVGSGLKYDARGMLLTDWGDMGHWQYWPVSYAPVVYGAALSWNYESRESLPLANFLSKMVFKDNSGIMGNLVLDMGRYNRFEEYQMLNMTTTMMAYMFGIIDKLMMEAIQAKLQDGLFDFIGYDHELAEKVRARFKEPAPYDYQSVIEYTSALRDRLSETKMDRPDAQLIMDEYTNAVRMIHLGALTKKYILYRRENSPAENIDILQQIRSLSDTVTEEHRRLWLARNREGGLDRSLELIRQLQKQTDRELRLMQRNSLTRFIAMTGEKIKAAAASVYIRSR